MNIFVRYTLYGIVSMIALCGVGSYAHAQRKDYGLSKTVQATGNLIPTSFGDAKTVPELIGTIVASVLGFLGIVFFLLIFYAGLVWMTAQGSEEKIERAKEIISAAVVGLVIVLAAYAFTQFVFSQLAARPGLGTNPTAGTTTGRRGVICEIITTEQECTDTTNEPLCTWIQSTAVSGGAECREAGV